MLAKIRPAQRTPTLCADEREACAAQHQHSAATCCWLSQASQRVSICFLLLRARRRAQPPMSPIGNSEPQTGRAHDLSARHLATRPAAMINYLWFVEPNSRRWGPESLRLQTSELAGQTSGRKNVDRAQKARPKEAGQLGSGAMKAEEAKEGEEEEEERRVKWAPPPAIGTLHLFPFSLSLDGLRSEFARSLARPLVSWILRAARCVCAARN